MKLFFEDINRRNLYLRSSVRDGWALFKPLNIASTFCVLSRPHSALTHHIPEITTSNPSPLYTRTSSPRHLLANRLSAGLSPNGAGGSHYAETRFIYALLRVSMEAETKNNPVLYRALREHLDALNFQQNRYGAVLLFL